MVSGRKRVVAIGRSSGIGFAVAELARALDADVVIASSRKEALDAGVTRLPGTTSRQVCPIVGQRLRSGAFGKAGISDRQQIGSPELAHSKDAAQPGNLAPGPLFQEYMIIDQDDFVRSTVVTCRLQEGRKALFGGYRAAQLCLFVTGLHHRLLSPHPARTAVKVAQPAANPGRPTPSETT